MDALKRCVLQLSRFPGVGERTATRLAYWLLRAPDGVAEEIGEALVALKREIKECQVCCDLVTSSPCARCDDPARDRTTICVVEQPRDIAAIERGGVYHGRYHVLHGAISPLQGVGPDQLRIQPLLGRIRTGEAKEVILAVDPDVEGDTTAIYLARLLGPLGVKVTRLAHGISVGTAIEYADGLSLARAMENRREVEEPAS